MERSISFIVTLCVASNLLCLTHRTVVSRQGSRDVIGHRPFDSQCVDCYGCPIGSNTIPYHLRDIKKASFGKPLGLRESTKCVVETSSLSLISSKSSNIFAGVKLR